MNRDDYLISLQSLMPSGDAWTREAKAELTKVLRVFATVLARIDQQAELILAESDPRRINISLEEWEENLALPDSCSLADATVRERIDIVTEKFTRQGGLSVQYYIELAAAFGYEITIDEFCPFEFGISEFGGEDVLADEDIRYMLYVNVFNFPVRPFEFGVSEFGEAFLDWAAATELECIIRRLQPSEAIVYFNYGEEDEV